MRQSENRVRNQRTSPAVIEEVLRSLEEIHYGELVITIHDAKVVQIEKREKTRFYECATLRAANGGGSGADR